MNNKLQLTSHERRVTGHGSRKNAASALIIAVILTSLLAIIGVMFIMIARVDKMATSAISENKELNFAVETVVALVSQELVLDVPRTDSNGLKLSEYYDYPGEEDKWLANLEPYQSGSDYYWRRISDIYSRLDANNLQAEIIADYQQNIAEGVNADADGDGVADSKWIEVDDINSNKGKPIYAAIRIVDNGAMINVNTAYKFDPNSAVKNEIDGSSQLQIDLKALARGSDTIDGLANARNPLSRPLLDYLDGLIWRIEDPCRDYLPFDISDELILRNRYLIDQDDTVTRLKAVWPGTFDRQGAYGKNFPYTSSSELPKWFEKVYRHLSDKGTQAYYNLSHISTIHNMDRIITPDCNKMTNVNTADVNALYNSIRKGLLDANYPDVNVAAQIAVNIIDYRDSDSNVNYLDVGVKRYYGFEVQPFISEIAAIIDTSDPNKNCYALELYNPFNKLVSLSDFVLSISNGSNISLNGTIDSNGYFVISNDLTKFIINTTHTQQDPGLIFSGNYVDTTDPPDYIFDRWDNYKLTLKRTVGGSDIIILDFQDTINGWFTPAAPTVFYAQRDTGDWHIVYQTMNTTSAGSLGSSNTVLIPGKNYNLSLANDKFVTVGDIARILTVGPSSDPNDMIIGAKLAASSERDVRIDLANPAFQQIFNYLTVFDPAVYSWNDPNETRIKGRININTAPWFVIAQLPWVSQRVGSNNPALAQAIVAYMDKLDLSSTGGPNYSGRAGEPGFRSIGELNNVVEGSSNDYRMDYYDQHDSNNPANDLAGFPDLTPGGSTGDGAADDFEERDVIFARISNLVTVRSDVFTAYILVRIGADGPQKRVMAILDRSNVYSGDGKVRIVALHPVPDPR